MCLSYRKPKDNTVKGGNKQNATATVSFFLAMTIKYEQ